MKILFLHGWHSVPGGVKPTYLIKAGHEVINPALDDDDFAAAVRTAQAEFDKHQPQVVVGSSRGGARNISLLLAVEDGRNLTLLGMKQVRFTNSRRKSDPPECGRKTG